MASSRTPASFRVVAAECLTSRSSNGVRFARREHEPAVDPGAACRRTFRSLAFLLRPPFFENDVWQVDAALSSLFIGTSSRQLFFSPPVFTR